MINTLGRVTGLVVALAEPVEILVLDPWHPGLVLLVVVHFTLLGVGRLLALLFLAWLAHDDDLW